MSEKQLPELPNPKYSETIRGVPCITLTEHEHLMRAYALQAIAQATQPADVTDEQIAKTAYKGFDNYWTEDCKGIESEAWLASAKAVLALSPVQVPISRKDLKALMDEAGYGHVTAQEKADFIGGFRHVEAHHDIKPKEQA